MPLQGAIDGGPRHREDLAEVADAVLAGVVHPLQLAGLHRGDAFLQDHFHLVRLAVLRAPAGFASFWMVPAMCTARSFGMVNLKAQLGLNLPTQTNPNLGPTSATARNPEG